MAEITALSHEEQARRVMRYTIENVVVWARQHSDANVPLELASRIFALERALEEYLRQGGFR